MISILDFNDNGGAIIEIPQIDNDYSLVINHWKSTEIQLQEIEKDLQQSDSEQRTSFLKKYAEELRKFEKEFQESDLENEKIEEYESEEEKQFYEEDEEQVIHCEERVFLHIYNFDLKHSLAWYLMNCVNSEIDKIEQKTEIQKGVLKACESIDEAISIIRGAESGYYAVLDLMKHFSLSKLQAKAVINLSVRDISEKENQLKNEIKFLQSQKSFLEKLK